MMILHTISPPHTSSLNTDRIMSQSAVPFIGRSRHKISDEWMLGAWITKNPSALKAGVGPPYPSKYSTEVRTLPQQYKVCGETSQVSPTCLT
ncbi:hypothetical protein DSO57_1030698 [Entomophthora muscae]|uniref:Uncharacterized protein n=1 Tax=Entomophthora muscae TaxID=34485 RepID=A0ACC2SDH8_9FUNG|nr:hypothetical protein DSO57_1030698 [Entomophthora muscae]